MQNGSCRLGVQIVVMMFVPMHVFGAVFVIMHVRVTVMRMPVIVPLRFAPALIRNPSAQCYERKRCNERDDVRVVSGGNRAGVPKNRPEDERRRDVAETRKRRRASRMR